MGRSLAAGKLTSIKQSFTQLNSNMKQEVKALKELTEMDKKSNKLDLAKVDKVSATLKSRASKIQSDIDTAYEVEKSLNDPSNGDPESLAQTEVAKDEELDQIRSQIGASSSEAVTLSKSLHEEAKKNEAEKQAKKSGADSMFDAKKRTT